MKRPPQRQAETVQSPTARAGLRALIADDEKLARQGIRMLLDRDAAIGVIEEAGNGERAAELMLAGGFDLIFLDVQMPEMDGFAALRRAGTELPGAVIFGGNSETPGSGPICPHSPISHRERRTDPKMCSPHRIRSIW
jgi:CheY-like chemotaxis protein